MLKRYRIDQKVANRVRKNRAKTAEELSKANK